MLAASSLLSSAYTLPALRGAPSLAARAPAPSMSLDVASQLSTLLASEASAVPLDAPFISQLGISASLFVGGNVLHSGAFGEVEEPQEVGVEEGVIDIYRDSPLRYMGYANECGEAFRPIVPVIFVILSYVAAISYVLADTVDKGKKGADAPGANSIARAVLGSVDTFVWQMLASVVFPSFIINRLVTLIVTLQATVDLPEALQADWIATVLGLVAIPLLITPLDTLTHWILNGSLRKVNKQILD